ncbi:hypothetical protein ACGF13_35905 [Kitasatospora sp. NPDC048286]|uniref:hypothetical protein n=1 Tax=Kitasatospora sp. NPDC048286 TaxID=3364047 RepID=UPI003714B998
MRLTADSDVLLRYSVTSDPDPLQVSTGDKEADATLTITFRGTNPKTYVRGLRITLPVGSDAASLTDDPKAIHTSVTPQKKWTIDSDGDGTFTVTPRGGETSMTLNDAATIELSAIPVNTAVGNLSVTVEETTSGDGSDYAPRTAAFGLSKWPAGFVFGDFRPDRAMVANGDPCTLTWVANSPARYTLYCDTNQVDVSNTQSYTVSSLHHTTGFLLQAGYTDHGDTVTHALTTLVTVDHPDVAASDLSADGTVKLLRRVVPLTDFVDDPLGAPSRSYVATTDGLLTGGIAAPYGGSIKVTAEVTVPGGQPDGTDYSYLRTYSSSTDGDERPITLPLPAGAALRLTKSGKPGSDPDAVFDLAWLPFGSGPLNPAS